MSELTLAKGLCPLDCQDSRHHLQPHITGIHRDHPIRRSHGHSGACAMSACLGLLSRQMQA